MLFRSELNTQDFIKWLVTVHVWEVGLTGDSEEAECPQRKEQGSRIPAPPLSLPAAP